MNDSFGNLILAHEKTIAELTDKLAQSEADAKTLWRLCGTAAREMADNPVFIKMKAELETAKWALLQYQTINSNALTDEEIIERATTAFGRSRHYSNCFDEPNERSVVAFVRSFSPAEETLQLCTPIQKD